MNAPFELQSSSVNYLITAIVEPSVIARVSELFALRGITPDRFKVSRYKKLVGVNENLTIDISVSGLTPQEQEAILHKLNSQVCVISVRKEVCFTKKAA